jgi:hypothetical protein
VNGPDGTQALTLSTDTRRPDRPPRHRGSEQPDQTDQAHRVRVPLIPELPHPSPALRRTPRLDAPRHHHPR